MIQPTRMPGKRDLGKAAQQDHVRIQLLEAGQGIAAVVSQFAVNIVLDHRHAGRARHSADLGAMRRRTSWRPSDSEMKASRPAPLRRHRTRDAASADRCRLRPTGMPISSAPASQKEILQPRIDGLFECDFLAGAHQRAPQQIERLLASVGDENVVRVASDAALDRPIEQIAPQRFVAARRAELHKSLQIPAVENFAATLAKLLDWKKFFRRSRTGEVDDAAGGASGLTDGRNGCGERARPVQRVSCCVRLRSACHKRSCRAPLRL